MPIDPTTARRTRPGRALLALAACLVAGCGDDGYGRRYPVYGTVTYNDEPVPEGTITFTPEAPDGRAASGMIVDGAYTLTTVDRDDGALPGRYLVSISANRADLSEAKAAAEAGGGAAMREDLVAAAPRTSLIPTKYNVPATSGLDAGVEERRNRLDFDLAD